MPFDPAHDPALALELLADRLDAAVETLLGALPVAGDRATQAALDDYLDSVLDAGRMAAAAGRDLAGSLPRGASLPQRGPGAVEPVDPAGWIGAPERR